MRTLIKDGAVSAHLFCTPRNDLVSRDWTCDIIGRLIVLMVTVFFCKLLVQRIALQYWQGPVCTKQPKRNCDIFLEITLNHGKSKDIAVKVIQRNHLIKRLCSTHDSLKIHSKSFSVLFFNFIAGSTIVKRKMPSKVRFFFLYIKSMSHLRNWRKAWTNLTRTTDCEN